MRPDLIEKTKKLLRSKWRFRTATGETANVKGEVEVNFLIVPTSIPPALRLMTDIEEEVILGMNIMNAYDFQINLKQDILKINNEEFILHRQGDGFVQIIAAEDTVITE